MLRDKIRSVSLEVNSALTRAASAPIFFRKAGAGLIPRRRPRPRGARPEPGSGLFLLAQEREARLQWIKSHRKFQNHPLVIRLQEALACSRAEATGQLHHLWWWCMDNHEGGVVGLDDVETCFGRALCQAFVDSGAIRANGEIDLWGELLGDDGHAERQRRYRERQKVTSPIRHVTYPRHPVTSRDALEERRGEEKREESGVPDSSEPESLASEPTPATERVVQKKRKPSTATNGHLELRCSDMFRFEGAVDGCMDKIQAVGPIKEVWLMDSFYAEMDDQFPELDTIQEFEAAKRWLVKNPTKRKTARGMVKYLIGWLERAQNGRRTNGVRQG